MIVNLESTDYQLAKRIIDFVEVQPMPLMAQCKNRSSIILAVPPNVDINSN